MWQTDRQTNKQTFAFLKSLLGTENNKKLFSGYQYNVSKSAVVTLTRCIGNEVIMDMNNDWINQKSISRTREMGVKFTL